MEFIIVLFIIFWVLYKAGALSNSKIYIALQNKGYKIISKGITYGDFEYIIADFRNNKTLVVFKKTLNKTVWVDKKRILDYKNNQKCEFIIYATLDIMISPDIMRFFNENNIEVWDGKALGEYSTTSNSSNGNLINSGITINNNSSNNSNNDNLSAIKDNSINIGISNDSNYSTDSEFDDGPIIDGDKKKFPFFNNKVTRL